MPDREADRERYQIVERSEAKERGHEAWALRLLADVAADRSPSDAESTEAQYVEALALAIELGMRPLVAHCHLGRGKLYRRTGKRQESDEHFHTAIRMYREMGMTYWLEKACDPKAGGFSGE